MKSEKIETTELKDIATEYNVDIVKAEETTLGLKPTIDARTLLIEEFETVSKLEINLENLPTFKELRLKFVKNRTQGIDKWHKTAKEVPLRMSQLIDAVKRNETQINETHESFLEKAEKHFEIQEQKRLEALQIERAKEISKYLDPEHIDNDLSNMNDMVWDAYLQGTKLNYDNRIAAEKKAEEDRIETERLQNLHESRKELLIPYWTFIPQVNQNDDFSKLTDDEWKERFDWTKNEKVKYDKKQEEIRKENVRLEKEAKKLRERTSKRNDELRPYIVFIREYNKLLAKDEKEYQTELKEIKIGAELQWEYDRKEANKKALQDQKDQQEKEDLRIKLKAKEDAEQIEKQRLLDIELAKKKAEKDAQLAPDKDKLIALSNRIINIELPQLKSKESIKILDEVTQLLFKVDNYIKEKVESL